MYEREKIWQEEWEDRILRRKKIAFYFIFYLFFPYIVVLAQVGQRVEKDGENLKQKVVKCLKKTKK